MPLCASPYGRVVEMPPTEEIFENRDNVLLYQNGYSNVTYVPHCPVELISFINKIQEKN